MINSIIVATSILAAIVIAGQIIGRICRRKGIYIEYSEDDTFRLMREEGDGDD